MQTPRIIGESIADAIDWTQDRLRSTRPIAEAVLFSLLADKKALETEQGFVLLENEDNDEELKRRSRVRRVSRPRLVFHSKRKSFQERRATLADRFQEPEALRAMALGHTQEGESLELSAREADDEPDDDNAVL